VRFLHLIHGYPDDAWPTSDPRVEFFRVPPPFAISTHVGQESLSRLRLRGDQCLLDAGCGNGRLTAELLEALPRGRVVALDISQNMLRFAREHLHPQFGARVPLVAADLQDLPFDGAFDGIVSTAAFHWLLDHDRLFRGLHRALRPGGWLQAQCGGGANLARLRERMRALAASTPYAPFLAGYPEPWLYQGAEGAAATWQRAGFVDVQTNLESAPTVMEDRTCSTEFVSAVIVRTYLEVCLMLACVGNMSRNWPIRPPPIILLFCWIIGASISAPASRNPVTKVT
jgi:trans-aconitate 2-methyltransferase